MGCWDRQLGSALLGNLQPKLLVVSTPNVEYNQVLRRLGSSLLANGLRNSDHRFEWYYPHLASLQHLTVFSMQSKCVFQI